ncbi:uncharacterized protein LOC114357149 [Ostrinia furnacalis]|uniref:uncharacterized protein LOC114357149 n=1 Tax=Ostrinia furnacalis TaxID=93504 RepID=UPI00103E4279|nr:uncharacterized protein LOC114357149 [Ostrinia furnacalis]
MRKRQCYVHAQPGNTYAYRNNDCLPITIFTIDSQRNLTLAGYFSVTLNFFVRDSLCIFFRVQCCVRSDVSSAWNFTVLSLTDTSQRLLNLLGGSKLIRCRMSLRRW